MWATDEFRAELRAFVAAAVGEPFRMELVAQRPWSTVWRVDAARGTSYVKQNCPGQAHEARLMTELARLAPSYLVPVVAADPDHDLLLTGDVGAPLAERPGAVDVATWCRIARSGAELQRLVAPYADRLALTRLLPADATTYVADAVGRLGALPPGDPRRLDPGVARRLEDLLPLVERWSDEVDELDLPITLLHNDLHPPNVVLTDTGPRFLDFADALLGEPLGGLTVPLTVARRDLGLRIDDPQLWRIADTALEVWSDVVPLPALRRALPAALQLGRLAKVEAWRRCVATMTPPEREQYGAAPADRLARLLECAPVGALAPLG
ncbi:hypothetical protein GCM10022237_36270 [Nocardioides ginsengisoli]